MSQPYNKYVKFGVVMVQCIFLHGCSSSGKSTLAKEIEALSKGRYQHFEIDAHLSNILIQYPHKRIPTPENNAFAMQQLTMRMLEHLESGISLLVDCALSPENTKFIMEQIKHRKHSVLGVAVIAPLDVLQAREEKRGDREIGIAAFYHQKVHEGITHELTVNTADERADKIVIRLLRQIDGLASVPARNSGNWPAPAPGR